MDNDGYSIFNDLSGALYGGWPLPFHDIIPHTEQDWVQFAHRGMAFITFFWIMITFIHALKTLRIEQFDMGIQLHLSLSSYK